MYIISTFDHSLYLEMALTSLEDLGITRSDIVAIPLDKKRQEMYVFDTLHRSDGHSLLDLAAVSGTVFMLLGVIYGFVLHWGPIIWGGIGLFGGAMIGLGINLIIAKIQKVSFGRGNTADVVVIINCPEAHIVAVEDSLIRHYAQGIAKLNEVARGLN